MTRGPLPAGPIQPGAVLGLLGGGQLGRMAALAAVAMGYRVVALDPQVGCPAAALAERCWQADFDQVEAALELAAAADVVTYEIEKISLEVLREVERRTILRPGASVLEVVQNRLEQRRWLAARGFPCGPWREATSAEGLEAAVSELGGRCFAKAGFGGYDGRGQAEIDGADGLDEAFRALGGGPVVVERTLELEQEISVLVARRPGGEVASYPPAWNRQEQRVLAYSVLPAPIAPELERRARDLAVEIADALQIVGLLCVELFVVDGELLVNELAPRPHNSYHASVRGSSTNQFEQLVRAVCDQPLGATDSIVPAAIFNLLGDLWQDGQAPDFSAALAVPGIRLHLYGKLEARPGRKMGHLSAIGETASEALARARIAAGRLGAVVPDGRE